MTEHTFELQRGGYLTLQAVSQYDVIDVLNIARNTFEEKEGALERPHFVYKLGGGEFGSAGEQLVPYDEQTILDAPDEDKKAWATYTALKARWTNDSFMSSARVLLCDGVIENPPEDDAWLEKYKRRGVEIPTDPDEFKVFWLERACVVNSMELLNLVTAIQGLAQTEVVRAAEVAAETFQDSVEDA